MAGWRPCWTCPATRRDGTYVAFLGDGRSAAISWSVTKPAKRSTGQRLRPTSKLEQLGRGVRPKDVSGLAEGHPRPQVLSIVQGPCVALHPSESLLVDLAEELRDLWVARRRALDEQEDRNDPRSDLDGELAPPADDLARILLGGPHHVGPLLCRDGALALERSRPDRAYQPRFPAERLVDRLLRHPRCLRDRGHGRGGEPLRQEQPRACVDDLLAGPIGSVATSRRVVPPWLVDVVVHSIHDTVSNKPVRESPPLARTQSRPGGEAALERRMILLVGATGNLGGRIARRLGDHGLPFRALIRPATGPRRRRGPRDRDRPRRPSGSRDAEASGRGDRDGHLVRI